MVYSKPLVTCTAISVSVVYFLALIAIVGSTESDGRPGLRIRQMNHRENAMEAGFERDLAGLEGFEAREMGDHFVRAHPVEANVARDGGILDQA